MLIVSRPTLNLLLFPWRWYSRSFLVFLIGLKELIVNRFQGLQIKVWLANLLVPMYGQTDFVSRIISFGVRLVELFVRLLLLLLLVIVSILATVVYLILPPLTVINLVANLLAL